jgi:MFS family permease
MMERRQFFILFLCNLIPWWVGSGLVSLLPLYAARLGAPPALVGNYLSVIFLALAVGTAAGGWLAARVRGFRQILVAMGALCALLTVLMGYVSAIWQLILLSATNWFAIGISISLVMILVGEHAEEGKRGRTFGLLALAASLGGVLGGVSGFIADHWGYTWLFVLAGVPWSVQILAAFFLANPSKVSRQKAVEHASSEQSRMGAASFGIALLLLLSAALFFSAGGFAGLLGRSYAMEASGFAGAAISLNAALAAGVGLVVTPLLGRLSDRGGRRLLLGGLYLLGALSLAMMAYADTSTDFMIVAIISAFGAAERGISTALASDLLPRHALSRGLSLFESAKWLGGVVGLAGSGYAIERLGLSQALLLSALLPMLAALLLLFLRERRVRAAQVPEPRLEPV